MPNLRLPGPRAELTSHLTQIPKFGIVLVLVVVLVLGALGLRDRKETDILQLICSVSLIAKRSGFSRTRTTPQIRNLGLNAITNRNVYRRYRSLYSNETHKCEK